ncbi:tubulin glycylase 3B-like [Teleopsis dalmanni]|uniref:tubulin glycylase 3B-like n=1 Tax=Teleopsis dalmanni TaxID=139649 RepID=UPI0018CDED7C|nr:tubulin glycylase 3B-like [Teleopsis dalmanni]
MALSTSKIKYKNPISKIRTLVQNLDAEIIELSTSFSISKKETVKDKLSVANIYNVKRNVTKLGVHTRLPTTKIEVRMLSSVYQSKVQDAYRNKRIFIVYGSYNIIRQELYDRGWLEKLPPNRYSYLQTLPEDSLMRHARPGNDYEIVMISKLLARYPAFFIWQPKGMQDMCGDIFPLRNRIRRGLKVDFSTKIGLIGCSELEVWYRRDSMCTMKYPRFYRLGGRVEERLSFVEDYNNTQCRSLIRYLWENIEDPNLNIDQKNGTVSMDLIAFALKNIQNQLDELENKNLDIIPTKNDEEKIAMRNFIIKSNSIIYRKAWLTTNHDNLVGEVECGMHMIKKLEKKQLGLNWEGFRNLWILKPGYQCRGIGIVVKKFLNEILDHASKNMNGSYIVQKYIERPLLIYKTKFDIRAYMLLTVASEHVSIWLYNDCYLRFSSQEFNMTDLREAIHLTNNCVQKKYKNDAYRSKNLPIHNMWHSAQFKEYLRRLPGGQNVWNKIIYPGFIQNLIAVVLASFEDTKFVKNSFEMYGCDFMLDEEFNPILIEINSTPDLCHSTSVTAKLCPRVQKDLIKIVVDSKDNPNTSTGQFNLIFKVVHKILREVEPNCKVALSGEKLPLPERFQDKILKTAMKLNKKKENATYFKNTEAHRKATGAGARRKAKAKKSNISVKALSKPDTTLVKDT